MTENLSVSNLRVRNPQICIVPKQTFTYQIEEVTETLFYIYRNWLQYYCAGWMTGICHIWSRGRYFFPSLPADLRDEQYLKTGSHTKRSPGTNLGARGQVRRSRTTWRPEVMFSSHSIHGNFCPYLWTNMDKCIWNPALRKATSGPKSQGACFETTPSCKEILLST